MANTTTLNPAIARYAADGGLSTILNSGRVDLAVIAGDQEIPLPDSLGDAIQFFRMSTAIVKINVEGGTLTATLYTVTIPDVPGVDPILQIAPGANPLSISSMDGWETPSSDADYVVIGVVFTAGTPQFSISISGSN